MLSQHKKIYWKNSDLETGQTKKSCGHKIRQLGKQEIKNQLNEDYEYSYYEYWYDHDYYDYDCCSYYYGDAPCSSCKINYMTTLGFEIDKTSAFVFTTGHASFLNDLISISSEYIWFVSEEGFSIAYKGIEFSDIKAFIDFHIDPSIDPIEWLIHPDAGIRVLASKKYARTE